jgi:hypothetical protein
MVFLPFAFSAFSLSALVEWLTLIAQKNSAFFFGSKFIRYMVLYSTPVLFYLVSWRWSGQRMPVAEKVYFWVFVVSLVVILFPATKEGAGTHYFFPFLAILIDLVLRHTGQVEVRRTAVWTLSGVLAVAILIVGVPVQKRFFRALHWQEVADIQSEIRTIMSENKGRSIEIGIGESVVTYPRTWSKTFLVLAGHPYSIDAAPAMELTMLKIPLPEETLAMVNNCKTDLWLFPKGEKPFTMIGYYAAPTLPPVFTEAFKARYKKTKTYKFFDVWACRKQGDG